MQKWLELAKYFPPAPGGIERVSRATAAAAHARAQEVTIVAFTTGRSMDETIAGVGKLMRRRVRLVLASAPLSLAYLFCAMRQLYSAQTVHLHMPNPLAALAVYLVRRRYRLLLYWHSDIITHKRAYLLYRWLERAVLRRAYRILITSREYAQASAPLQPHLDKLVEVRLGGIDLPVAPIHAAAKNQTPMPRQLLACGRLVPYKGFETVLDALARLPTDYRLAICGDGPLRGSLSRLAAELGVRDRVDFKGHVADQEYVRLLASADVFCVSSNTRAEAFGLVVLEAFAAGLPVVSPALVGSGLRSINTHGVTGRQFPTGDAAAMAQAIMAICEDRQLRQRLSMAALCTYRRRYDKQAYADRFAIAAELKASAM